MKCVLCYSGGLDSTVLLYHLLNEGHTVRCLSVNYGQRHRREVYHASAICDNLGVQIKHINLSYALQGIMGGSSQTDQSIQVPEGHYAEDTMKATVVPNRNAILLSLATAWAISTKSDSVAYAAHAGDHTIYPDCREEFIRPFAEAMSNADWHKVKIERPFITKTKADIVTLGAELRVPFEKTWSCYKGGDIHCGRCGTCCERLESFHLAGVTDPTEYDDSEYWKTVTKETK